MTPIAAHDGPEVEDFREYRLLAESIPNLAWIAGPDGAISWYNRRWYEYTGTTPEQMAGWGWQSVHDPDMLSSVLVRWRRSIATGQRFEMTFPLRGVDGVFRPFLTRVVPMKDEHDAVQRWFGTNTEVGDELRQAAALRASEERFRTATEAISGVLWTNDASGQMHGEQPGWSGFTGQTAEQYEGYGWASAVHPDDAQPTIDAWQQAVAENRLFSFEHRVLRHDGVYRLCAIRALPIRHEDGSVREWVGVHTDITPQRQAEEALRRSDKLAIVGRLAASIAHEINNPLEALTNLLYLLNQTAVDTEQRALCRTMMDELHRVSEIANQTLRFQRQATTPGRANVEDLMQSVLKLFAGRLRHAEVETRCRFRAKSEVCGHDGELRQVLANLVGNAIDALSTPAGQRLLFLRTRDVRTSAGEAGVVVTIADSGTGIPPTSLAAIFEPFFTTKGEKGTGLGLWISGEIVRRHAGRITVRSSQRAGRHGTVFRMFLPVQPRL